MVAMNDIKAYCSEIARMFHPQRIILFGSHARGTPTEDSDVDLMVVLRHRGHAVDKAIEIRRKLPRSFAMDLLVRSPAEMRKRIGMGDSFIQDIVEHGKVLYEADDQRVSRKG